MAVGIGGAVCGARGLNLLQRQRFNTDKLVHFVRIKVGSCEKTAKGVKFTTKRTQATKENQLTAAETIPRRTGQVHSWAEA